MLLLRRVLFWFFVSPVMLRSSFAQQSSAVKIDSSFRTTYYEQKRTLFELLPNTKREIIFLGNSITDIGEWTEILNNKRVKNRGVSGDVTFGVLNRLDEVTSSHPAKIFLMIGINDLAKKTPDHVIISNYRKIVERIQRASPKTKIYLQSVLPTNNEFAEFERHQNKDEHIRILNKALEEIADKKHCTFLNLYPYFLDADGKLDKKYTNDGLHLKGEGYMLWKSILLKTRCL